MRACGKFCVQAYYTTHKIPTPNVLPTLFGILKKYLTLSWIDFLVDWSLMARLLNSNSRLYSLGNPYVCKEILV